MKVPAAPPFILEESHRKWIVDSEGTPDGFVASVGAAMVGAALAA
jgi:hypothetical protein